MVSQTSTSMNGVRKSWYKNINLGISVTVSGHLSNGSNHENSQCAKILHLLLYIHYVMRYTSAG